MRRITTGYTVIVAMAAGLWPSVAPAGDNANAEFLEKLRACVRSKAPAAQVAGVQTIGDAERFSSGMCADCWGASEYGSCKFVDRSS